ncbi:MAG: glycosyltransferase [Vulcanimicrobiota bacterium]
MKELPIGPDTVLVAIPTYNEKSNIFPLLERFKGVPGDLHILYMDDNSPDGTAEEVERAQQEWPNLLLMRRPGKLGLGTAHMDAIQYAYEKGYRRLATLDADLTHDPQVLPKLLALSRDSEIVVGSRHLLKNSLPGWNLYRRFMTHLGHWLTRFFLKMPYDATGALRVYNLETIPRSLFELVRSNGYSFFYESLFILWNNGCRVAEVPVELPSRTYGSSKMTMDQVLVSAFRLVLVYSNQRLAPDLYKHKGLQAGTAGTTSSWDRYWGGNRREGAVDLLFDILATWFRGFFNRPYLDRIMGRFFQPGERVLHAGCGSGQVDRRLRHWLKLEACDLSFQAVRLYNQHNHPYASAIQCDLMALPHGAEELDGVYNLGVMEHFSQEEILKSLREFWRVLRPGGRLVLFWPPRHSPMFLGLRAFQVFSQTTGGTGHGDLYPPELSRVRSRAQAENWLRQTGFKPVYCEFSWRDLFTQYVFVAVK